MGIVNSDQSYSGLVEKYIGTAYDNVKIVADNIDIIIELGEIDDLAGLPDLMAEAILVTTANKIACEASEENAAESETNAAASAAAAAISETSSGEDAAQTAADVVITNENAIKTAADVITTDANRQQTQIDVAQTQSDVQTTAANASQTQADVVSTAQNATDAETAATEAEAAWDTFNDFYLGAHPTEPMTDGDGGVLQVGALYQDTSITPNIMKFWNGTTWLQAYSTTAETNHAGLIGLGADDHQQYILATGLRAFTGPVLNAYGSVSAPAYTFSPDQDTGIYSEGLGTLAVSIDGVKVSGWGSTGYEVVGNLTVSGLINDIDISDLPTNIDSKEDDLGNPTTGADCLVSATNGTRAWETRVKPSELSNGLAAKENSLGNPDVDGKVISSTLNGVRSWIPSYRKWIELEDTPNSLVGQAGRSVVVSGSEDTLVLVDYSSAIYVGETPKESPNPGALWLNSDNGQLYTWYVSPINGSTQWIKDNESTLI